MRFSRIELTNFRSFGPGKTVIALPNDTQPLALIGGNNAGKSNLLDAFRLVLGARGRYDATPSDFHDLDVTQEMRIELYLRDDLIRETIFHGEDRVVGFFLRAWQSDRAPDKGRLKSEHYGLDPSGGSYTPPASVRRRAAATVSESAEPVRRLPTPARQLVNQLGRVHYLGPSLYGAFDTAGRGPLAQLMDLYRDDFRRESNTYDHPTTGERLSRAEAFNRVADRLREILETEKLTEIEGAISRHLDELLAPNVQGAEIAIGIPSLEDLMATGLRLEVQDHEDSPRLDVQRLGAGYQSLLRLAVLETYADLANDERPAVFLVEEPEVYLHPHLRRHLRTVLGRLAAKGHDIVLTTHDPAFVPLESYRGVLRLSRPRGTTHTFRCGADLELRYERLAQKLRRDGNAEVLFASRAILCEGPTDAAVVRALLERVGVDCDVRSVSVADCGGRPNIPDYVRLLDAFSIEVFVVQDGDETKAQAKSEVARSVQAVIDIGGDRVFSFREDLEHALSTQKRSNNDLHLVNLIDELDVKSLGDDHEVRSLVQRLEAFARAGS